MDHLKHAYKVDIATPGARCTAGSQGPETAETRISSREISVVAEHVGTFSHHKSAGIRTNFEILRRAPYGQT